MFGVKTLAVREPRSGSILQSASRGASPIRTQEDKGRMELGLASLLHLAGGLHLPQFPTS